MFKMTKMLSFVLLALTLFMLPLAGCSSAGEPINIDFDLNQDVAGWGGGFVDLPVDFERAPVQVKLAA